MKAAPSPGGGGAPAEHLPEQPSPATQDDATRAGVRGELRDFLRRHEMRRRQAPRAFLVGLLAGLVAVAFRWSLDGMERLRSALIDHAHALGLWAIALPICFGAALGGLAVWLVRRMAPEAAGSGIQQIEAVLLHLFPMRWRRILPVKFPGGLAAIGAGLAVGREGPTIQMGGAIGQMVGDLLRGTERERRTLVAAGAGAGLAAAFNAPLAGLVFVLEEVQRDFTPTVFTSTFVAAVTADVVARWLTGQQAVFHVTVTAAPPLATIPMFALLGLIAGGLGVVFNRSLLGSLNVFRRADGWPAGLTGAVVGAGVGLVGWFAPGAVGTGGSLLDAMLAGRLTMFALLGFFALRFVLTMGSYGSGAPGGIFAPLLVLGAQIGLVTGGVAHRLMPSVEADPTSFAVVGMAAYFTSIVRAPLTGIVLIAEMTGGYALMLPLLVACFVAYATADLVGDLPIYEGLLERELTRGRESAQLAGNLLLELNVEPGAPYDSKEVRELSLPPGCVLVAIRRGRVERVPVGELRILANDRLVVVIAEDAAGAITTLRKGTKARRAEAAHDAR